MGVQGLWRVLEPTAKPVQLGNLRGKVLAIDASIWIYHFLKAMRDSKGTILAAAHIIGFFRRICKLLFFEIRPVFVFDGAAPILKKQTTQKRGERRQGRELNARATANKLLTLQLQRAAQQEKQTQSPSQDVEVTGAVPSNAVYMDQLDNQNGNGSSGNGTAGPANTGHSTPANFVRMDQYHLPDLSKIAPVSSNDQRMLTEDELQEYSRTFSAQARAGFIDTSTVDFHSPEFQRLPIETQYQLLNMARLKSRLRMGYTAEELEHMFPNEMDFSRFQINRVAQRNFFTQRLMNLVGLEEDLTRRVSSEKNKEYMLKRNEEGWTLSLEDSTKGSTGPFNSDAGSSSVVNDLNAVANNEIKEEGSDDEFEDVDIEPSQQTQSYIEETQPSTEEPNMDLSTEESARLDELFGFEAKLSREDLYNKMMQEVSASDETDEVQASSKNRDWKPASFLFGSSANNKSIEESKKKSVDGGGVDAGAIRKNPSSSKDSAESRDSVKPPPTPLPWFNRMDGNFEEMQIQNNNEDPHIVPYEQLRDLSETDEDESFEEVDLEKPMDKSEDKNEDKDIARKNVESVSFVNPSPGSPLVTSSVGSDTRSKNADFSAESDISRQPIEPMEPVVSMRLPEPSNTVHNVEPTESSESVESSGSAEVNVPLDTAVSPMPVSPILRETDIAAKQIDQIESKHVESTKPSERTIANTNKAVVDRLNQEPMETNALAESTEAAESDKHIESMPAESASNVPDLHFSEPESHIVSESEPVEFSPEAAERAEEEAKAAVDEDEDIAAMLIAEAEENERFAKELAEQNHKVWTEADQLDYNAQVNTLRTQFAKETRDSDNVTQEMIQECQELLQFFGIPYITAPGEAEAQCAELRHLKLVDGVVTDDGDTFLFDNDTVVYRNMFSQSRFVECYTTRQIKDKLGLDRNRLIDLAFLLGSDYTEGILGIGPVTGVEILAEFGSLKEFAKWWNEAQRFPDNAGLETPLRRRLFKQFKSKVFLPEDFPSKAVSDAYLHPTVDKDATKFNWGVPDIDGLRKFMSVAAGWSTEKINMALLPVVQEAKRRELQHKTGAAMSQSRLDDYYNAVVQNPELQSKRAAKATSTLRKKAKK